MDVVEAEKGQTYKGIGSFQNASEEKAFYTFGGTKSVYVQWNVFLVSAIKNKTDGLTRVPKHCLKNRKTLLARLRKVLVRT